MGDYKLGDLIKRATNAVGIKPCKACEERAEKLNEISRRGVLKGLATFAITAPFLVKNATLKSIYRASGATFPGSLDEALMLMRYLNTLQRGWHDNNGGYASQGDILGPNGLQAHVGHFVPGTAGYEWISRINFTSNPVLPGWSLDLAVITEGYPRMINEVDTVNNGVRIILRGQEFTLISDEVGIIYQALTPTQDQMPTAESLNSAANFPGAIGYNLYPTPSPTAWERFKRFLTPVVYANACNCSGSGCAHCILQCCSGITCWNTNPPRCYFNAGCNGTPPCIWVSGGCRLSGCTCCVTKLFNYGCCMSTQCPGQCPNC